MRLARTILLSLLLPACAGAPASQAPQAPEPQSPPQPPASAVSAVDRAAASITPDDIHERISFLASDALRGRDTPSPGLEQAANYIAEQFRSFGLQPAGDSGSYIQRWEYRQAGIDAAGTNFRIENADGVIEPEFASEYFVLPSRADSVSGALVYAGTAQQGLEPLPASVAGQVPVFQVPGGLDGEWQQRVIAALAASATARPAALLLVLDTAIDASDIGQIAESLGAQMAPLPILGLRHDVASRVFERAGLDLDRMTAAPVSSPRDMTGEHLTLRVARSGATAHPPNVVAILPGADPALRNQYVVFSAHIDHVGVGAPDPDGDSIYNGADDDASGTTTMIEVAQAFASLPERPARSMIFLGVSGEEKGLLGSAWFVKHPPVPIDSIVADINLDMVGRNAPDSVVAIGMDYSSLGPLIQQVAKAHDELGLTVAPDLWPEERLFFRSDHFNFAREGVPALFFTSGLHDQYHRPSDEVALIDTDKMSRIGRLVFYLAYDVATAPAKPEWTAKGRADVKAMTGGR